MKVKVLKAFDAYPDGKTKTHFPLGDADIPSGLIEKCIMVKNGLVKKTPKET